MQESLDTSKNEEAWKIVEETKRKSSDSVAGMETIHPELLNFLLDLATSTKMSQMLCDKYNKLEVARTFREALDHLNSFQWRKQYEVNQKEFSYMDKHHL